MAAQVFKGKQVADPQLDEYHLSLTAPEKAAIQRHHNYSLRSILYSLVCATDQRKGSLLDCYFDEQTGKLLFWVVSTGWWVFGHKVLVEAQQVQSIQSSDRLLYLTLTREQLMSCPIKNSVHTVGQLKREEFFHYFRWPYFWTGAGVSGIAPRTDGEGYLGDPYSLVPPEDQRFIQAESHVQSAHSLLGYRVEGPDGFEGHIEDILLGKDPWSVQALVLETMTVLPGKQFTVPISSISHVFLQDHRVQISLSHQELELCPEYHPWD